ncbi:MAG: T9SS type A sorting domain-containing protein [Bacteroidota bacterium]
MKTKIFSNSSVIGLFNLIILLAGLSISVQAQMPAAIAIDPPDATAYDELTLTFDPALACFQNGSLAGLPSIAMHSGVTFITGGNWQNVVNFNGTGYNGQPPTLLPTGDGKYAITYIPAEFYGLTGQTVTQLCIVFNNGTDWSQDGRDFIPNSSFCMDFFIPLNFQLNNPEFHFNLNMNKMILDGNFNPLNDQVYVEIDEVDTTILTDDNQDGIYSAVVDEGIEVDITYLCIFRINNDQYENVTREITAVPGVLIINAWWNNISLCEITFMVDMNYQAMLGNFNPETDYVDIAGTMNNWQGSPPLDSIGLNLYSATVFFSEPGVVEYKFRINGNWVTSEFPNGGPNRMTWAIPEPVILYHYYDDCNPDTWPATFVVNMNAEISSGAFDPADDYLDIAGSMNGWGGHQVLFDREWTGEGVYTIKLLIDKNNPFIQFKFRINGDWATSEFPVGGPDRTWMVQDTTGGLINEYYCMYNVTEIPYPPYVYNLFITGELVADNEITGHYTYFDPNADFEGESVYQWFVSEDPYGANALIIDGAIFQSYVISREDIGRYLIFQVTPVAISGDPSTGYPAAIISGPVGVVNNQEIESDPLQINPNPANEATTVTSPFITANTRLLLFSLTGQLVIEMKISSPEARLDISTLPPGMYIIELLTDQGKVRKKLMVE